MRFGAAITAVILSVFLSGCLAQKKLSPVFFETENPQALSAWGVISVDKGELSLGKEVLPYSLNTPLFTDYAHKLRTIWIENGSAAYREGDVLDFPVGTVISKTFYYPITETGFVKRENDMQPVTQEKGLDVTAHKLIETRLLVRRDQGWEPLSYVWNAAQTDARLTRIGDIKNLTMSEDDKETAFSYVVPNINQCAGCHAPNNTTRALTPIGPKASHLNGLYSYADGPMNQLDKLTEAGFLKGAPNQRPATTIWDDKVEPLGARARAYLDVNCAHCHNPVGPADTSGLHLNPENISQPHLGICKTSVAAGSGTGGRPYDIMPGAPDKSITVYRMESRDPSAMMPELGRSLTHDEGVTLIADWISAMKGRCE